jgi:hydrogenase-4 component B
VTALTVALTIVGAWLAIGVAAVPLSARPGVLARVLFPASAVGSIALVGAGVAALWAAPETAVLPFGLPDLPVHLRLDALAAFFLLVIGIGSAAVSIYSAGYFGHEETPATGVLVLQYQVFVAAMTLVVLADDAYAFMVAWETMALASFFLVLTEHRVEATRRAAFLYLLIAHVGAIALLLCFGVLQGAGDLTFAGMRALQRDGPWPAVAFFLALAGFGAKAGLVPLHVWLPDAHPAAPSPVSALLSGVMLKTAIYGLLRVAFDLLHGPAWWWGVITLAVGLVTALYGVIFATVQTDMKRLLAYSSIENIGIIVAGIGLALLFAAYDKRVLAAIALAAVLYHTLNHAVFKTLLFLATGSVLHATHERSLGRLGGLIRRMPWVAATALVGTLAIAGLPPLNGFVSEWLLLQAFLFTPSLPQSFVNMLVPLAAAALVLAVALAAYVMVKFYGVVFLGRARDPSLAKARDAGPFERTALVLLAGGCAALGLFPVGVMEAIDRVNAVLVGQVVGRHGGSWVLLAPIDPDRASYSPVVVLLVVVAVVLLTLRIAHRHYHGRVRHGTPWDCGFPAQTARMQDTAEGFGQPIRQVFEGFFRIERTLPSPSDPAPRYSVVVADRVWHGLYLPVARAVEATARFVGLLQQGRIAVYLMYSFVTLLALLFLGR